MLEGEICSHRAQSPQRARRVAGEPVLLLEGGNGTSAELLYAPSAIRGIKTFRQESGSLPGDFSFEGRSLHFGDGFPHLRKEDLYPRQEGERTVRWHTDGQRYLHFSEGSYFHQLQLWIDYETDEPAQNLLGRSGMGALKKTAHKLGEREIRIALLGDSISTGANASSRSSVPPFQGSFFELWLEKLKSLSGLTVESRNFSVGGKTSAWGCLEARAVAQWKPDLVIVAFGMNDASENLSAEGFAANLQQIKETILRGNQRSEFIWLSGMTPNPAWHLFCPDLREQHHRVLAGLTDDGAAFCDVMTGWTELVAAKGFWSLTGNGVNHPNDYGHRLYCDCLTQTINLAAGINL